MTGAGAVDGKRYRAFISYSHKDAAFANRLHRRLESYVLPKRLGADRRLTPIFKDREELPAAHDLSAQVRAALAKSECLIVVCSPDAAGSPWVGREIETFRALRPDRPILAALWRGEPTEAFPPALSDGGVEPLAADFRKEGDGQRLALLKLAAGVARVGVDQLIQRDAQRRLRSVMAVTVAALVGMLAMGGITALALDARAEAERQRFEAEGLVEFMLTDLRDRLRGIGKLNALVAANQRALDYFADQNSDRLSPRSALLKAEVLNALGEDEAARGDLAKARRRFSEARRITSTLFMANPDDPPRIWAEAQSEYWSGFLAYQGSDRASAKRSFDRYRQLSERLIAIDPQNPRYLREAGYAEGNLCSLALVRPRQLDEALRACSVALERMKAATKQLPASRSAQLDLSNRYAWMADAYHFRGDLRRALELRRTQEAIVAPLVVAAPSDMKLKQEWIAVQRALGILEAETGDKKSANRRFALAKSEILKMTEFDPENLEWAAQFARLEKDQAWLLDLENQKEQEYVARE